jgi:hypothetical protein
MLGRKVLAILVALATVVGWAVVSLSPADAITYDYKGSAKGNAPDGNGNGTAIEPKATITVLCSSSGPYKITIANFNIIADDGEPYKIDPVTNDWVIYWNPGDGTTRTIELLLSKTTELFGATVTGNSPGVCPTGDWHFYATDSHVPNDTGYEQYVILNHV